MAALADRLRERIRREGPITFYDWMNAALYDPEQGYYCRPDLQRWGREGDYRTSPERSVLFAATFARYFAKLFENLGSPEAWVIAEAGAGSGHFAQIVLETLQQRYPQIFSATTYYLDEASAGSRARAGRRLARFGDRVQFRHLAELEAFDRGVIFANELLDAFPVHRVIMKEGELLEAYVGVDDNGSFEWTIGKLSTERLKEYFSGVGVRLAEGQEAEVNLTIEDWLELVSHKVRNGYLITVDYGAEALDLHGGEKGQAGTLRAFHRHQFARDVLSLPGDQDITSSVDWTLVKMAGARHGFEPVMFERQDRFLLSAGLVEEFELRMSAGPEAERTRLSVGAREMILPEGMASSFQVLVMKR